MTAWGLIIGFVSGCVLGALFSVSLRFTVERMMTSKHPYVLLVVSFAIRLAIIATAMLLIATIHWTALVACMVGFVLARSIVVRMLAPVQDRPKESEERHG